jgi:hypothetical protein
VFYHLLSEVVNLGSSSTLTLVGNKLPKLREKVIVSLALVGLLSKHSSLYFITCSSIVV